MGEKIKKSQERKKQPSKPKKQASKPVGRRTKLTKQLIKDIGQYIGQGNPNYVAASLVGISEALFYQWKSDAELLADDYDRKLNKREELLLEFLESIKRGEAEAIQRNVIIIQAAARESWQAAAWYLERRAPNDFGRTVKFAGHDGGAVKTESKVDATVEGEVGNKLQITPEAIFEAAATLKAAGVGSDSNDEDDEQ